MKQTKHDIESMGDRIMNRQIDEYYGDQNEYECPECGSYDTREEEDADEDGIYWYCKCNDCGNVFVPKG